MKHYKGVMQRTEACLKQDAVNANSYFIFELHIWTVQTKIHKYTSTTLNQTLKVCNNDFAHICILRQSVWNEHFMAFLCLAQHKFIKKSFPFVLNYHRLKLDMYIWKDNEIRLEVLVTAMSSKHARSNGDCSLITENPEPDQVIGPCA